MADGQGVPRVRRAPIPADALIVVRGDDLASDTPYRQAVLFRRRYDAWGRWGLSAFYARNEAEVDDLAADQLARFPVLGIYQIGSLQVAGYEVVPTFRTPHVTIAFVGDLEAGLRRLRSSVHQELPNPYYWDGEGRSGR